MCAHMYAMHELEALRYYYLYCTMINCLKENPEDAMFSKTCNNTQTIIMPLKKRYYVFDLITRFVCLCVCLSVITFVARWLDLVTWCQERSILGVHTGLRYIDEPVFSSFGTYRYA